MAPAEVRNAKQLERKLESFGWKIYSRWSKQAIRAGCKPILYGTRAAVPKRTGALKKALGQRIKPYKRSMNVIGIIGPRTDFVASRQGDRMIYLRGGKAREAIKAKTPGRIRPFKYAHLVEGGTKARRIKNWFGRRGVTKWVGRMPAQPFLKSAFRARHSAALSAIVAKLREGIAAEARR